MIAEECLFCKIISGKIPSTVVYETKEVLAFKDVRPQSPTHVLFIPKEHVRDVSEIAPSNAALMGELVVAANALAKKTGISESGYRLVINCKKDGGQTVDHLHMHLLGGRPMTWPPG